MKKPFMCVVGGSEVAIFCALALATACTGAIGPAQGNSGQAGGNPAGVGGTGTPGSGSSTGAGGSASGSAGTGATGAAQAPRAVPLEWPTWEQSTRTLRRSLPAPGLLRRLTRNQFRNAVRDVFGVRRQRQRSRRRQLHRELREHRRRHRGDVRSRGRAVQHGHRERRQRGVRRRHEALPVHRVHADRPEQRHLRARLHPEARASRLAPAARERGARSIRRARRQRVDDPGQRDRGGALGDGGAVHVAELPLSPGARSRLRERRASAQRLRDRVSPLVPDLEQPSRPDADGSGDERDAGNRRRDPDRRDADAECVRGARIRGRLRRGVHAARSDRDPGEGSGAVPRIRNEPAGGHGPRHPRHLGVAGVRRSGELLRSVHDHEGRRERGSGPPLRHRCHRSDLDHLPDQVVAGRRHAQRRAEQGRACCRSSRTSNRAPPRCAGSSSANR